MTRYPHLAARVFNTPLLVHPQKLDAIISGLGQRLLGTDAPLIEVAGKPVSIAEASTPQPSMFSTRRGARAERGYTVIDGVAVIGVSGALVHRSQFVMADSTFLQGYNDLAADLEDAMSNGDVHAVLIVCDSPGGEVQGVFELAARIMEMRGRKPIYAIADGMAASAAYLTASAADQVAITGTGYAGSIGVVMRHVDLSRAMANDGIAVTHIFAGAHKIDGNPFEPLPKDVRADLQADIEDLYSMFVDAVGQHRAMPAQAVRDTRASTFRGAAAVKAGLADRIATTDQLITELAALRPRSFASGQAARSATADSKGASMSGNSQEQGGQPTANLPAPAAHQQPGAGAASAQDLDRARAEGAQAERARVNAILGHASASANPALAMQCVNTGLTAEQASAILGAAAPQQAAQANAAQGNQFAQAMQNLGNPRVSGVEAENQRPDDPAAVAGSWDRAFGVQSRANN